MFFLMTTLTAIDKNHHLLTTLKSTNSNDSSAENTTMYEFKSCADFVFDFTAKSSR